MRAYGQLQKTIQDNAGTLKDILRDLLSTAPSSKIEVINQSKKKFILNEKVIMRRFEEAYKFISYLTGDIEDFKFIANHKPRLINKYPPQPKDSFIENLEHIVNSATFASESIQIDRETTLYGKNEIGEPIDIERKTFFDTFEPIFNYLIAFRGKNPDYLSLIDFLEQKKELDIGLDERLKIFSKIIGLYEVVLSNKEDNDIIEELFETHMVMAEELEERSLEESKEQYNVAISFANKFLDNNLSEFFLNRLGEAYLYIANAEVGHSFRKVSQKTINNYLLAEGYFKSALEKSFIELEEETGTKKLTLNTILCSDIYLSLSELNLNLARSSKNMKMFGYINNAIVYAELGLKNSKHVEDYLSRKQVADSYYIALNLTENSSVKESCKKEAIKHYDILSKEYAKNSENETLSEIIEEIKQNLEFLNNYDIEGNSWGDDEDFYDREY